MIVVYVGFRVFGFYVVDFVFRWGVVVWEIMEGEKEGLVRKVGFVSRRVGLDCNGFRS